MKTIRTLENKIVPFRQQIDIKNRWLEDRMKNVIPMIMGENDFDMWLVIAKEYNEDPVMMSMLPASMCSARRRTILVFAKNLDGGVDCLSLSRPGTGVDHLYKGVWTNPKGQQWNNTADEDKAETQWECLNRVVNEYDPKKIGVNVSHTFAFGDGLTKANYDELVGALDKKYVERLDSAEKLCVRWLEHRTDQEIAAYDGIVEIAHTIISEAFSSEVVIPGVTTNNDVKYYMIQRVIDLGLRHWFDFEVSIFREGLGHTEDENVILPGDILHCDVGLEYLGLCTDTQHNAYVLKLDEEEIPKGIAALQDDLKKLQNIVISNFVAGKSGNQILAESRQEAIEAGLEPCIYTHPIGNHGHGAGTTIGLWDMQGGVPGNGDYPLFDATCHSLELNISSTIPEWNNQKVTIGAETDILFKDGKVYYVNGRQENMYKIK